MKFGVFKKRMNVYDLLTEKDKETFMSYIRSYGINEKDDDDYSYSLNQPYEDMASPEYILRYWAENKNKFLGRIFKDSLIIKVPIQYRRPIEEIDFYPVSNHSIIRTLKNRCNQPSYYMTKNIELPGPRNAKYLDLYWDEINSTPPNISDLPDDFIFEFDERRNWTNWTTYRCSRLFELLSITYYYYDNIYNGETFYISFKYKKPLKIQQGAKFSHTISKILDYLEMEKSIFDDWRIRHSQIINSKIMKGNLCFSIHPLDYITMSDGTFSSCMNWANCRGYRRGTVEVMNSENAIVVYMEQAKSTLQWHNSNKKYEWNLKKWRTLVLASPDFICTVKAYPYYHKELLDCAVQELEKMYVANGLGSFEPIDTFDIDSYRMTDSNGDEPAHFISFDTSGAMYCDFGSTHHHIALNENIDKTKDYYIDYSGPSICMFCGADRDMNDFVNESCVFCIECMSSYEDDYVYCCECGDRCHEDECYWVDNDAYCPACFEHCCTECSVCHNYIHKSDALPVLLTFNGINEVDSLSEDEINGLLDTIYNSKAVCTCCANRIQRLKKDENDNNGWFTNRTVRDNLGVPAQKISFISDKALKIDVIDLYQTKFSDIFGDDSNSLPLWFPYKYSAGKRSIKHESIAEDLYYIQLAVKQSVSEVYSYDEILDMVQTLNLDEN